MATKKAIEIAKSAWDLANTRSIYRDPNLVEAFADIIDAWALGPSDDEPEIENKNDDEEIREICLDFAVRSAEQNYDVSGQLLGSSPDKIISSAQKFYDFVKGNATKENISATVTSLQKN